MARQLVQMGYLDEEGEYHTLSLTPKAFETLKKRSKISGKLQEVEERAPKKANKSELEYNHALFAILRSKRKELGDSRGVPPYVIFSDRTLVEMSAYTPLTTTSLLNINGIGQVKAREYGDIFLKLIQDYCNKHGITENFPESTNKKSSQDASSSVPNSSTGKHISVAREFNAGKSLQQLTEQYGVTIGTIINHLVKYSSEGNSLKISADLMQFNLSAAINLEDVFAAFDQEGTEFLKPVYTRLNSTVNYDDLKILRLIYLINKNG